MKLQSKSLIRFFVSPEWETYGLGLLAILLALLSTEWIAPNGTTFVPNTLAARVLLLLCLLLLAIHLTAKLVFKNSYSKRFLPLNVLQFALLGVTLYYGVSLLTTNRYTRLVEFNQSIHWLEAVKKYELAIVDSSHTQTERVWTVPFEKLGVNDPIQNDEWKLSIVPRVLYRHSTFADDEARKVVKGQKTVIGIAASMGNAQNKLMRMFPSSNSDETVLPGGLFEVQYQGPIHTETLLLSPYPDLNEQPDTIETINKTLETSLRKQRFYPPFKTEISYNSTTPTLIFISSRKNAVKHPLVLHNIVRYRGYSISVRPSGSLPGKLEIVAQKEPNPIVFFMLVVLAIGAGLIHLCQELTRTHRKEDL